VAHKVADFVKETTTTSGTGTINLGGAVAGFRTFVAGIGNGNTTTFAIKDGSAWEISTGTVTDAATDTLSRTLVASSTGALLDLSGGSCEVYCVFNASFGLHFDTDAAPDNAADWLILWDAGSAQWKKTNPHNVGASTLQTEQATTSGTTKDFTIPAGTKRVVVMLVGVSTNGGTDYLVRLGDVGGIEATGYVSTATDVVPDPTVTTTSTTGFVITAGVAASDTWRGRFELSLEDASDFTWVGSGSMLMGTTKHVVSTGHKALSQELTTVRLTSITPNTFDAGAVNVQHSG
jgi:hypothetical protein